jgi:protein-S-isoprenylcysteine O-methyltransferase Ste14
MKGWIMPSSAEDTAAATAPQAKGELVTDGLYGVVRHPQYLGLILGVVAFLIQWPTLPTLVMGPILVVAYLRLARREEQALGARFGDRYRLYRQRVQGFLLL